MRGATIRKPTRNTNRNNFNPRAPCGARLPCTASETAANRFQSTRPMRGATRASITRLRLHNDFNPRAPCGARQNVSPNQSIMLVFQSTRPMRGATWDTCAYTARYIIFQSTRPMRGATTTGSKNHWEALHFNPRAPCGARHTEGGQQSKWRNFNPRAPCGARRRFRVTKRSNCLHFNPRAPCGARLPLRLLYLFHGAISIHAPHAGRDWTIWRC